MQIVQRSERTTAQKESHGHTSNAWGISHWLDSGLSSGNPESSVWPRFSLDIQRKLEISDLSCRMFTLVARLRLGLESEPNPELSQCELPQCKTDYWIMPAQFKRKYIVWCSILNLKPPFNNSKLMVLLTYTPCSLIRQNTVGNFKYQFSHYFHLPYFIYLLSGMEYLYM